MLSGTCAFCGNQTHFTARVARFSEQQRSSESGSWLFHSRVSVAATCDACHEFNVATGWSAGTVSGRSDGSIASGHEAVIAAESMDVQGWSPPLVRPVDTAFIPEAVAGYFKEAHDAFSIGAYRSVLLLVRSLIEATAKELGAVSGSLVQKINKLHEEQHIRKGTKEMAHALRILGNDMAHGDIEDVPTREDADDALVIARFVLDDVYVADARRADMMARRGQP